MKKIDMTQGRVSTLLLTLALPIIGSSLLQFTYQLVDMLWVGRLGSEAVASVGSSTFFIGLGYAIQSFVVIGTGISVAHAIGEKNKIKIKSYINAGTLINLIVGALYALFLTLSAKRLIGFLDLNHAGVSQGATHYLLISAPMLFFNFFNLLYARLLNAHGNNQEVLKINLIGILLNLTLDPILIYGCGQGVSGAAWASLIANGVMTLLFYSRFRPLFRFQPSIGFERKAAWDIVRLGFPMALQRILFTFVNIVLAKCIAIFGQEAIAAQKIGLQLESIVFMVIGGINGAIASFVGQNHGAKQNDRIRIGVNYALGLAVGYAAVASLLFILSPRPLTLLFIQEEHPIRMTCHYLQVIACSQLFSAIEMVLNGFFTGIKRPNIPALISIIFTCLRIPLALLLMKPFGVTGIWLSIAISSLLKGCMSYYLYRRIVRRRLLSGKDTTSDDQSDHRHDTDHSIDAKGICCE